MPGRTARCERVAYLHAHRVARQDSLDGAV